MNALQKMGLVALDYLAVDIWRGADLWPQVDRIERRFNAVGYVDYKIARWDEAKAKHDARLKTTEFDECS